MTSRDLRGLIQIPNKIFFDSKKSNLCVCKCCRKFKNIPRTNNGICNICIKKLIQK